MKLTLEAVSFERQFQLLLSRVSGDVSSGELLQVRGANGSGKSTLLRLLAGFIEPQAGSIQWQSKNIYAQRETYQQQLHYIGHQNGIKSYLSVRENIQLLSAISAIKTNPEKQEWVLKQMRLDHLQDVQAQYLSAGQQRRVGLARLLLYPKPLWILDEPITALDDSGQQMLVELLNTHLEKGGMAVVATHHSLAVSQKVKMIQLGD